MEGKLFIHYFPPLFQYMEEKIFIQQSSSFLDNFFFICTIQLICTLKLREVCLALTAVRVAVLYACWSESLKKNQNYEKTHFS